MEHTCEKHKATCGNCGRSWCYTCDPGPSALCPWCNGRGYSTAPLESPKTKRIEKMSLLSESIHECRLQVAMDNVAEAVNDNAAELIQAVGHCHGAGDLEAETALEAILTSLRIWMDKSESFMRDVERGI